MRRRGENALPYAGFSVEHPQEKSMSLNEVRHKKDEETGRTGRATRGKR